MENTKKLLDKMDFIPEIANKGESQVNTAFEDLKVAVKKLLEEVQEDVSKEEYRKLIKAIKMDLKGKLSEVLK